MVAVRGLVVSVPLIGCGPVQPPEAMQLCALTALHCKVVAVPLATLLFFAIRVTVGFDGSSATAVALSVEGLVLPVSADEESLQAASAANTAQPSAKRKTRKTVALNEAGRSPLNWMSCCALR